MTQVRIFKSHFSTLFYVTLAMAILIVGFATYKLLLSDLNTLGFLSIVILIFSLGYFLSFRFDCIVSISREILEVKYILPFRKTIKIKLQEIAEVDKHPDSVYRYYKKLFINTRSESYLIKYNISDDSDIELLNILKNHSRSNTATI